MQNPIDILARTLWGEARGEGPKGLRAVAHVVKNRVDLAHAGTVTWWGTDMISVCQKPYQFSCWNAADPNFTRLIQVDVHDAIFRQALAIATRVMNDPSLSDPTKGATHYHRFDIQPKWAKDATPLIRIGAHVFYRIV